MSALVEAFLDALAAERGAAGNTIEAYRRDLQAYVDFLAAKARTPLDAGDADVRALQAEGGVKGLSPASVARRCTR